MSRRIIRSFAFLDLCGFTAYMDAHGDDQAVAVLSDLRTAVRTAAEHHGVRVDKWLGDGLMLIGMEPEPVLACAVDIRRQMQLSDSLVLRGGVTTGPVLLFEGNEYIGPAVNVAARLCSAAQPSEILVADGAGNLATEATPAAVAIRGLAQPIRVRSVLPRLDLRSQAACPRDDALGAAQERRRN